MVAKKGAKFLHLENDGMTSTRCALAEPVTEGATSVRVKWLEPRWDLKENLLVNRKGTFSTVAVSRLCAASP